MEEKLILVVDDSKTSLMMSQMILKKYPCRVITAEDGAQAVEVAASRHPDLILMDVVMPNMNGFEALKAIRSNESIRHIPIIMVTTRSEADNIEVGFRNGCNDYVIKPFSSVELLEKIENLIG